MSSGSRCKCSSIAQKNMNLSTSTSSGCSGNSKFPICASTVECCSARPKTPLKDMNNRNCEVVCCKKSSYIVKPTGIPSSTQEGATKNTIKKTATSTKAALPLSGKSTTFSDAVFWKKIQIQKQQFKRTTHFSAMAFTPVLRTFQIPLKVYDASGVIYDGIPSAGVRKPPTQESSTNPTFNIPNNRALVSVQSTDEVLPFEFLEMRMCIILRTTLINWIVHLRNYLEAGNNELFMTIRIFDQVLAKHKGEKAKYQLFAISAFWISYKFYKNKYPISAEDLLKLCLNRHTVKELMDTEQYILQFLDYKLHAELQMSHVFNYVCITLKISSNNDIYHCANFFLEVLSLDPNCNCYPVSLQSCAAVYLALKIFKYNEKNFAKLETAYWSHKPNEMYAIHTKLIEFLILMNDPHFRYRHSYDKFAKDRYGRISEKVSKIIADL